MLLANVRMVFIHRKLRGSQKVLVNYVIFNKQNQLYSALKWNIISKYSNGFHLEETTQFIKKVLFYRLIQLYLTLKMNNISKCSNGFHLEETTQLKKKFY